MKISAYKEGGGWRIHIKDNSAIQNMYEKHCIHYINWGRSKNKYNSIHYNIEAIPPSPSSSSPTSQILHQTMIGWLMSCDCHYNIVLGHTATHLSTQKFFEWFYIFTKMPVSQQPVEQNQFFKINLKMPFFTWILSFFTFFTFSLPKWWHKYKNMIILADFDKFWHFF